MATIQRLKQVKYKKKDDNKTTTDHLQRKGSNLYIYIWLSRKINLNNYSQTLHDCPCLEDRCKMLSAIRSLLHVCQTLLYDNRATNSIFNTWDQFYKKAICLLV